MNIARTRDSVTRQERSRAVVAKDARSAEDKDISLNKGSDPGKNDPFYIFVPRLGTA
jgi:hypothetical protein